MKKILILICIISIFCLSGCKDKSPKIELENETILLEVGNVNFKLSDLAIFIHAYTYEDDVIPFENLSISGEYDIHQVGKYPLTITATDGNNISSTTVQLQIVDTQAPQLYAKEEEIIVYEGSTFDPDPMMNLIFAYDNYDGMITDRITYDGEVNEDKTGSYPVTYSVSDTSGNTASATVTYRVTDSMNEFIQFIYRRTMDFYWGKFLVTDLNNQVLNLDDAMYYAFTNAGTAQFERASGLSKNTDGVESGILLEKREDKIYISEDKSSVVNNYLHTEFTQAYHRSPVTSYHAYVSYKIEGEDNLVIEHEFSIKKVKGKWYVENFILPNS